MKLASIIADISDIMSDNQMIFTDNGRLNVVANKAAAAFFH